MITVLSSMMPRGWLACFKHLWRNLALLKFSAASAALRYLRSPLMGHCAPEMSLRPSVRIVLKIGIEHARDEAVWSLLASAIRSFVDDKHQLTLVHGRAENDSQ